MPMDQDFWNNLAQFGFATAAAGGVPGATLGGSIGQGGLAAQDYARQMQMQHAQTAYMGAETKAKNMQANMMLLPIMQDRWMHGLPMPQVDQYGNVFDPLYGAMGGAQQPTGPSAPGNSAGMPQSPSSFSGAGSVGSSGSSMPPDGGGGGGGAPQQPPVRVASNGTTPMPTGGQNYVPPSTAAPPMPGPPSGQGTPTQGIPTPPLTQQRIMAIVNGQVQPTPSEALVIADMYHRAGNENAAKAYEEYGNARRVQEQKSLGEYASPQYDVGLQGDIAGSKARAEAKAAWGRPEASPKLQGQIASSRAWGEVDPHLFQEGFQRGPQYQNGQWTMGLNAIPGGKADPRYLSQVEQTKLRELRGANSTLIDPYNQQTWQVQNEFEVQDPKTGMKKKIMVPVGIEYQGGGGAPIGPGQQGALGANNPPSVFNQPGGTRGDAQGQRPFVERPGVNSFITDIGPSQRKLLENLPENYIEESKKKYEGAMSLKASLALVQNDINNLGDQGFVSMGFGANQRGEFARAMNTFSQMFGGEPLFDLSKVASWEDMGKQSTIGGLDQMSQRLGMSKEAAQTVQTGIKAYPGAINSRQGANFLVGIYREGANHETDLHNTITNFITQHPGESLVGVAERFNQERPPEAYANRAISMVKPFIVDNPQRLQEDLARHKYLPGTRLQLRGTNDVRVIPGDRDIQIAAPQ